ncbi:hypothetical protein AB0K18_43380 [Nonomuraea sp. NPDC049421]|uniref:hypothetical protein n=1 Tax=Nonomuraea sp. NPDC049421 TaxID=3155275 RepID=UPI003418C5B9
MFKRRLAVLGAAAVLAVTGLGGSALADGADPADAVRSPAPGVKVTCTTADGKVVELARAMPASEMPASEIGSHEAAEAQPFGRVEALKEGVPAEVADTVEFLPVRAAALAEGVAEATAGNPAETIAITCKRAGQ